MSTEKLIQFIMNPDELNEISLPVIEEWIENYPFFQTAYLLHIKNIQNLQSGIDEQILHRTAAYACDRKMLYYLLHKLPELPVEQTVQRESHVIPEKEIKDSLQENISDTITRQKDIYRMDTEHEIELIPGLAIDIRKEYGSGMEYEESFSPFRMASRRKEPDLLEIADDTETTVEAGEDDIPDMVVPDAFTFDLEPEADAAEAAEDARNIVTTDSATQKEVFASEEELARERSLSFTDWLNHVGPDHASLADIDFEEEIRQTQKLRLALAYNLHKPDVKTGERPPDEENIRHDSLIDKFIRENPRIVPKDQVSPNEDMSAESIKEHESFFTDTLAKIYIKQGNYAKAIFAYEKLSLKYPEKSAYFAGQISKIKKLINKS